MAALQTFAEYALSKVQQVPRTVVYANIHSERDGPGRESVANAVLRYLQHNGVKVSKCHYSLKCPPLQVKASDGNTCGAPHSLFSRPEAQFSAPHTQYWEDDLFNNIKRFFLKESDTVGGTASNNGNTCMAKNVNEVTFVPFAQFGSNYMVKALLRYK